MADKEGEIEWKRFPQPKNRIFKSQPVYTPITAQQQYNEDEDAEHIKNAAPHSMSGKIKFSLDINNPDLLPHVNLFAFYKASVSWPANTLFTYNPVEDHYTDAQPSVPHLLDFPENVLAKIFAFALPDTLTFLGTNSIKAALQKPQVRLPSLLLVSNRINQLVMALLSAHTEFRFVTMEDLGDFTEHQQTVPARRSWIVGPRAIRCVRIVMEYQECLYTLGEARSVWEMMPKELLLLNVPCPSTFPTYMLRVGLANRGFSQASEIFLRFRPKEMVWVVHIEDGGPMEKVNWVDASYYLQRTIKKRAKKLQLPMDRAKFKIVMRAGGEALFRRTLADIKAMYSKKSAP